MCGAKEQLNLGKEEHQRDDANRSDRRPYTTAPLLGRWLTRSSSFAKAARLASADFIVEAIELRVRDCNARTHRGSLLRFSSVDAFPFKPAHSPSLLSPKTSITSRSNVDPQPSLPCFRTSGNRTPVRLNFKSDADIAGRTPTSVRLLVDAVVRSLVILDQRKIALLICNLLRRLIDHCV